MIAKIVQGRGFKGVVGYVLDKVGAQLLFAEGVRTRDKDTIVSSFIAQSSANPISKPVAHVSLNFSAQDAAKLTDAAMAKIAAEYMAQMGYDNTQFIMVRHTDRSHPHIHLVINRIDNNGKRISDKNERFRSTKICRELTEKYGLYVAPDKQNVNRHRLREPDKTKYEIYDAIKATVPRCRNWNELTVALEKQGITTDFRYNGNTNKIQGIRFAMNGYTFNGSQIDRSCSYSKLDFQLSQSQKPVLSAAEVSPKPKPKPKPKHAINLRKCKFSFERTFRFSTIRHRLRPQRSRVPSPTKKEEKEKRN